MAIARFTELDCFLAAAKALNFSQAARELRISPSSLSEQIAKLEVATKRRLFDRTARGVSLTRAGAELVPLAVNVVAAVGEIDAWSESSGETALRVGVAASSPKFRSILTEAAEHLPNIRFELRQVGFTGGVPALRRGDVDCALVFELTSTIPPEGFHTVELWTEELMAVVPATHALAARQSIEPSDLWGEVLITASSHDPAEAARAKDWYAHIDASLLERSTFAPLISGPDETMDLVAAGVGINVAGASAVSSYARPGIVFVPLRAERRVSALLLVRDEPASSPLARFAELARVVAKNQPAH